MVIENFLKRFHVLNAGGVDIKCALDIGAYRGDFTETLKSVWPHAIVYQFEADQRQAEWLQQDAVFTVLGDCNRLVDFYTLGDGHITTGSSIFLENTGFYTKDTTVLVQKEMVTLDYLDGIHNFWGQWTTSGFVKIDTQGSELLILDGARRFLEIRKPRYILLECSVIEYNIGAPKINTVVEYMNKLSYNIADICDLSYGPGGKLIQADILFEKA